MWAPELAQEQSLKSALTPPRAIVKASFKASPRGDPDCHLFCSERDAVVVRRGMLAPALGGPGGHAFPVRAPTAGSCRLKAFVP